MMLLRLFMRRREQIEREAASLIAGLDDRAYSEALARTRGARGGQDREGNRFWSKVPVTIAGRTGRKIEETDRYQNSS
jgi:hypothetical protein